MQDGPRPVGFMGVQERKIEMLFLHPDYFRKGLGKIFVELAFRDLNVEYVDVNEQNPDAIKFYERAVSVKQLHSSELSLQILLRFSRTFAK